MLVIWGRTNSINVQKVLWCAEELALEYRRVDAGGAFGIVNTPEYRKLNPNGLVPTIEDDGVALWESNAIVRYLAAKYPAGGLWPDDLRARGLADQWLDWSHTTFLPAMRDMFLGLIRTAPEQRDLRAIEQSRVGTAAALEIIDAQLAAHEYLAGDAFSMGDIAMGCGVWRWLSLPIEHPDLPSVRRWFDRLALRPPFRKAVMLPLT
ncbi:MAG: glutathione S-transferase family protein [Casimicrobiaceae bacterium]